MRYFFRSVNTSLKHPWPQRSVSKSVSYSDLPIMAEVTHAPGSLSSNLYSVQNDEDKALSTLPDPRCRALSTGNENLLPPSHPSGLSNEVTTLSNKLIHAINHQTSLDDTLCIARQELTASRERVKLLERENQKHRDLIARGFLIRKSSVESVQAKMVATITEERRKRMEVEMEKKNIELELENLTTALFEEANQMVINAREDARKKIEDTRKKNEQLKAQIADTESLLKSHQQQLAELKLVMAQMTKDHDELTNQTCPSSPSCSKPSSRGHQTDKTEARHIPSFQEQTVPTQPTNLPHLLHTVLRTDIPSYYEFLSLLKLSRNTSEENRSSIGSFSGIGISLGIGSNSGTFSNSSATSPRSLFIPNSVLPTASALNVNFPPTNGTFSSATLKDTKFFKRTMIEDIEPTLRLESAPGLSWLARRNVMNAIREGTLIVEPMPLFKNNLTDPCTLCGESRIEIAYARNHQFKTTENENAQRYPLCDYCVGRVRSTCDFLGFLRNLKDGHWRCEDEEAERAAWDKCVRLREQMFWCRIGCCIVPLMHNHQLSFLKIPFVDKDTNYAPNWLCKYDEPDKEDWLNNTQTIQKSDQIQMPARNPLPSPANSLSRFDGEQKFDN